MYKGICDYCNEPFEAKREAKFCPSKPCKHLYYRAREREKAEAVFRAFVEAISLPPERMKQIIEEERE